MATATNGDTNLYYETAGDPSDPTMLLVMGLGAQLTRWSDAFVDRLVAEGFHVVRHDNRDVGLSTKTTGDPTAGPAYTLQDMADDAVAVLDAVGVERAHVCGASMGGMIVQTMAIHHPERVSSMCSIMSTTGDPTVGQAEPEILMMLVTPPPDGREAAIAAAVDRYQAIAGPHFDREETLANTNRDYDRCWNPIGQAFQIGAIMAGPDRTPGLAGITAPSVVIHGRLDRLIGVSGGQATAAAIPGAKLVIYDDMAHDVPKPRLDDFIEEIVANTRRAR